MHVLWINWQKIIIKHKFTGVWQVGSKYPFCTWQLIANKCFFQSPAGFNLTNRWLSVEIGMENWETFAVSRAQHYSLSALETVWVKEVPEHSLGAYPHPNPQPSMISNSPIPSSRGAGAWNNWTLRVMSLLPAFPAPTVAPANHSDSKPPLKAHFLL